jgi:hypothetical protein
MIEMKAAQSVFHLVAMTALQLIALMVRLLAAQMVAS